MSGLVAVLSVCAALRDLCDDAAGIVAVLCDVRASLAVIRPAEAAVPKLCAVGAPLGPAERRGDI